MKESVKQKFSKLLETNYGLQVTFLNEVPGVLTRHPDAPFVVSGADLIVPVRSKGMISGAICLENGIVLPTESLERILEITDAVIGGTEELLNKQNLIDIHENHLAMASPPPNVVSLSAFRNKKTAPPKPGEPPHHMRQPLPIGSMLLEGAATTPFHQIALELHYHSKRWCFVSWKDLDFSSLKNAKDLLEMGSITIFIEGLDRLPPAQSAFLSEYLNHHKTDESPQILASLQGRLEDFVHEGTLSRELAHPFLVRRFRIPEPWIGLAFLK